MTKGNRKKDGLFSTVAGAKRSCGGRTSISGESGCESVRNGFDPLEFQEV
jgi:hypothetical protein